MVYLIVGIALFFLAVKGYCGKKASCFARDMQDASLLNLLRMLLCMLIGLAVVLCEQAGPSLRIEWGMLLICLCSGLVNALFMISWLFAVKQNSMVLMDVSLTMGSLIPSIVCALAFAEPLSATKFAGFALILAATVILAKKSGDEVRRRSAGGMVLMLVAMLSDGCIGLTQQLYKQFYTEAGTRVGTVVYPKSIFHFYTYVFAALALLGTWLFFRLRQHRAAELRQRLPLRILCYIVVMAVSLFAASYFQTVATNDYGMSSQLLYPLIKGGCLISVNFVAMIFFGERMTRRTVLASCIAIGGMIVMSIG